jgi:MFS family permease
MNHSINPHANSQTCAQWMVLIAAFLGWMFDGLEQGVFPLVARPALQDLLHVETDKEIGLWMGYITALFLVGAAGGGLFFGWLGDRVGRVRAMILSVLAYSIFTGCSYTARGIFYYLCFGEQLEIPSEQRGEGRRVLVMG